VAKIEGVTLTYDILYTLGPFQKAVCQKDDKGNYCVLNATKSATKRSSLNRRVDTQEVLVPDVQKFNEDDILFLGIDPNVTSDQLCTSCTRNVMNVYTTALNTFPYAPGLKFSVLLQGQPTLYAAINTKCGASFLGGQVQAAGGLATGAAPRSVDSAFALVGSVISTVAMGAIALL
jgi:hypothetical protein